MNRSAIGCISHGQREHWKEGKENMIHFDEEQSKSLTDPTTIRFKDLLLDDARKLLVKSGNSFDVPPLILFD